MVERMNDGRVVPLWYKSIAKALAVNALVCSILRVIIIIHLTFFYQQHDS